MALIGKLELLLHSSVSGGGHLRQLRKQGLLEGQFFRDALDQQAHTGPGHIGQVGHGLHTLGAVGHAQRFEVVAHMGGQRLALDGIGLDHGDLAAATGQHDGHVHAHGAAAHHHGERLRGMRRNHESGSL